jgi:hypothetical protein
MKPKCLFFLLFVTNLCLAQVNESFSDGDFYKNPIWEGNVDHFFVNNAFQLQSKATTASYSSLFTVSEAFDDAVWQAWVKITYPTSSSNFAVVYLTSDVIDVSAGCNAYYVQIGNTSDEVSLYLQQGTKKTKIIDGIDKRTDASVLEIQIKVTRDAAGNFALYSKLPTETDFVLEGMTQNTAIKRANYFGVAYSNTSTTGNAYYFDNLMVSGNVVPDNDSPLITSVNVLDINRLQLIANEAVDVNNAKFNVNNGIGDANVVELKNNNKVIELGFAADFKTRQGYTLSVVGLTDKAGNELAQSEYRFGIVEMPNAGEILWNEIMFENHQNSVEYVEIINTTDKVIDLSNFVITTRKSDATFNTGTRVPNATLLFPKQIMAFASNVNLLIQHHNCPPNANIVETANWAALNNESATLVLLNADRTLVLDELTYDKKWHHPSLTTTKGVALERLNTTMPSKDSKTWHSAGFAHNYGTPGFENSQTYEAATPEMPENNVLIEPAVFSPDNDGKDDVCFVHYKVDTNGYVGNMKVLNAQGVLVKELLNNVLIDVEGTVRWDGTNTSGNLLTAGVYVLYFEIIHATTGKKLSFKKPIVLTRR